jgi:hypothetical protein
MKGDFFSCTNIFRNTVNYCIIVRVANHIEGIFLIKCCQLHIFSSMKFLCTVVIGKKFADTGLNLL